MRVTDEFAVRLVERDGDVGRHRAQEAHQLITRDHGAGGVVRVADEDQPGLAGDALEHGVEVVHVGIGERHLHRRRPADGRDDRIGLERAPRVDDLIVGVGHGLDELRAQRHRPAPDADQFRRDVQPRGQRLRQLGGGVVRIAVETGRSLGDPREHRGQRRVGHLVARELDRAGHRTSGYVGRQRGQRGPQAHGLSRLGLNPRSAGAL